VSSIAHVSPLSRQVYGLNHLKDEEPLFESQAEQRGVREGSDADNRA